MREKYVDERWPRAMIFGEAADGRVDVCTVDKEIATMERPAAEAVVKAYNELQALVVRLALAFDEAAPEAFTRFWYGSELDRK